MTLSETDKIVIEAIVLAVAETPAFERAMTSVAKQAAETIVSTHQKECPVAKKVDRAKWFILGVFSLGGLVGITFAPAAIKLLLVLLA